MRVTPQCVLTVFFLLFIPVLGHGQESLSLTLPEALVLARDLTQTFWPLVKSQR